MPPRDSGRLVVLVLPKQEFRPPGTEVRGRPEDRHRCRCGSCLANAGDRCSLMAQIGVFDFRNCLLTYMDGCKVNTRGTKRKPRNEEAATREFAFFTEQGRQAVRGLVWRE
jgi:hypothetical protein